MQRSIITLLGTLVLLAAAVTAQVTGGSVNGNVVDANGAALPNATVTLTSKTTGQTLTTQTTGSGAYKFPNVAVGEYDINIEANGFANAKQVVNVTLNQTATVDAALQAGGVAANVEVTAGSEAVVQTDNSQLGSSYGRRQVLDLPIFGNQNSLATLAPNVVQRSAGVRGVGGAVGGTRPRGNTFNVDGVDNNDASITGPVTAVIQDAIQEFSLLTNNYGAEFGTGAGGQFNTITKTGTNEFHGSGFYYGQSEKFNALSTQTENQIQAGTLTEKPRYRDNRYGATFGGPAVKNKLFFFGAVERQKQNTAAGAATYIAPTSAGLTQIAALPGASSFSVGLLRDHVTLASTSDQVFNVLGTNIPFGTVSIPQPAGFTNNLAQINIDHTPNSKDQFRYRFSFQRNRAEQSGGQFVGSNPKFNNLFSFDSKLFSATWVRTINSAMVNDLRVAFRRRQQNFPLKDPAFNIFPNIFDNSTGIELGPNSNLPQGTPVDNNYQVFDTLNYLRGAHNFKFGGEFRQLIFTSLFLPRARGDYVFANFNEFITDSAPSLVNLRGVGEAGFVGNQRSIYFFVQDDWKARPDLTLNLGMRYEYVGIPRASELQARNAVSDVPGVIGFGVPPVDKNNFAPRIGFAYAPNAKSRLGRFLFGEGQRGSLRANFATTYYPNFQNLTLLNLPPQVQTELNLPIAQAVFGTGTTNFLRNGGLPGRLPPANTAALARQATGSRIADLISPYSLAWTLSYQRELAANLGLEVRYLSTRSRHLPIQIRRNAGVVPANLGLPTFFSTPTAAQLAGLTTTLGNINTQRRTALGAFGFLGAVTEFAPVGNSQYDSGAVSLTRRFSNRLGFTAAYTFSKGIDDSSNELNSSALNPRRPQDAFNLKNERGLSALDIPHRLAVSFNYDIPTPFAENQFSRQILGGWQFNGIFEAQSGQPGTPISGTDSNRNGDAAGDRTIINLNGVTGTGSAVQAINAAGAPVALGSATTVAYLVVNPNAQYIQAGPGAIANAGRNTLRTNGYNLTNIVLNKNIYFTERLRLALGVEVFDLFNNRPHTIGTALSPSAQQAGLQQNATFISVGNGALFNNYNLGDYSGRELTFRAKFIF